MQPINIEALWNMFGPGQEEPHYQGLPMEFEGAYQQQAIDAAARAAEGEQGPRMAHHAPHHEERDPQQQVPQGHQLGGGVGRVPEHLMVPPPPPPRPEDGKGKGKGQGKGKGKGKDWGDLTTLGLLQEAAHPNFQNLEEWYLKFIHKCLTVDWTTLQCGTDNGTLNKVCQIFRVLELDRKAIMDWFLLAHSGIVGRTEANYILWYILDLALQKPYLNLSNKVSALVGASRKTFDRPPKDHGDRRFWAWHLLEEPHRWDFSPTVALEYINVPFNQPINGVPLLPPRMWHNNDV